MPSPDPQAYRAAQVRVRAAVDRDLDRLWQRIWSAFPDGPTKPYHVRDAFLQQVPVLVARYGDVAASLAADWYEQMREQASVGGSFSAQLVDSPYLDAVDGAVRRTASALWTPQPKAMLTALLPVIGKYVLAAGRATIQHNVARDPQASGWQRVTRADACTFCRMLAGRGAVYKKTTAFFASHDDCNCAAVPSWDHDAPEVDVGAYAASVRTTHMSPAQRNAHNARVRAWMSAHEGEF